MSDLVRCSKFMSLVLRHQSDAAGIALDAHGWTDVSALLQGMRKADHPITAEMLEEIVRTDNKQRYSFNADHTKIRANQGHSVPVDLELKPVQPPEYLWHGTAERFLGQIFAEGLRPMSRQYVHLSPDQETAYRVGLRHGKPVILRVKAGALSAAGTAFYISENGVWLTDAVPPEYLEIVSSDTDNGKE